MCKRMAAENPLLERHLRLEVHVLEDPARHCGDAAGFDDAKAPWYEIHDGLPQHDTRPTADTPRSS